MEIDSEEEYKSDVGEQEVIPDKEANVAPKSQNLLEKDVSDEEITVKVLIRSADAGSVIGKAGFTINELQTQSSARLKMSRTNQYYPGTMDRVLVISGTVGSFLTAVHLIFQKIYPQTEEGVVGSVMLRMVVPNKACGGLIGEKGSIIQAIGEDSGAKLNVSSHKDMLPGIQERIVTFNGGVEEVLRALALVCCVLLEEPSYKDADFSLSFEGFAGVPLASTGAPAQFMPLGLNFLGEAGKVTSMAPDASGSMSLTVDDHHVGALLGKGGKNIQEIMKLSGTRIVVSRREEMSADTKQRTITISGTPEGCVLARWMIERSTTSSMHPAQM